jgi:hypothetical protein
MIALQISHNGKVVLTVGSKLIGDGLISAGVEFHDRRGKLSTLGVSNHSEEAGQVVLYWKEGYPLEIGDVISIKILEASQTDVPDKIENPSLENQ